MKQLTILLIAAGLLASASAQTKQRTTPKRIRPASESRAKLLKTPADSAAAASPAIDSFRRTLRYSPGRPYQLDSAKKATAVARAASQPNVTNTNANATPQDNASGFGNTQVMQAAGVERNRADVNQRPVNENSKNAISSMNSSQVNALNNNQMAPPPANWGNTQQPSNWGRNTVGESQWNPGDLVTQRFIADYPVTTNATWSRDVSDTANFLVRYQVDNSWATSTYTPNGVRINTRTALPLSNLPQPVAQYYAAQKANNIQLQKLTRVNMPGKGEIFELVLSNGRTIWVNSQGNETTLQ